MRSGEFRTSLSLHGLYTHMARFVRSSRQSGLTIRSTMGTNATRMHFTPPNLIITGVGKKYRPPPRLHLGSYSA